MFLYFKFVGFICFYFFFVYCWGLFDIYWVVDIDWFNDSFDI